MTTTDGFLHWPALRRFGARALTAPLFMLFSLAAAAPACAQQQEFALRDGDTVAFLGDSITAAKTYGKIVENYALLRFPERKIRFLNAGKGGDTAEGSLQRLEREVFERKATAVLVVFGINDIGWGMKANDDSKRRYLKAVRTIVERCKERGVRVYVCSAAVTGADPEKSENDFLQKMNDEGMALSRSMGEGAIDISRSMRQIQRKVFQAAKETTDPKAKPTLHAEDGIHLNDYGQIAMAYAILKGLGAPAEVSSATLDARSAKATAVRGCSVTKVSGGARELKFVRLDQGLPMDLGLIGHLARRFVPIPDEIGRYMLAVRGLEKGSYEIRANERLVGIFTSEQLEQGVNLASATPDPWEPGGPWDAQAAVLRPLTDARGEIETSMRLSHWYVADSPNRPKMLARAERSIAELETLQRLCARPVAYRFVVRKTEEKQPD